MTVNQWIAKLEAERRKFILDNKPLFFAASTIHAEISRRIFEQGKNVSNKTYSYSNKEIYLSPIHNRFSASSVRGKKGKERKIKNRKTKWFSSYAAYRKEVGLDANKVVFENQGDLRSDMENIASPGGKPFPIKVEGSPNKFKIAIRREDNIKKVTQLEKKYKGSIFKASSAEKKKFMDLLAFEITKQFLQ